MTGPILVTGGTGQVGRALRERAPADLELVFPTRAELDLADPAALAAMVASRRWAAAVNCAAYTAVDQAETDVAAAWAINALAPAALAAATKAAGIPLVQLSTDYVFDGAAARPYEVDDRVGPLGVYGASKLGGELAVRTANPAHVILRTAWVVSPFGANFIKTMLRLGAERPELRVVADQRGCPTSALDIADAVLAVLRRLADPAPPYGTYHFVNDGATTWHELATRVLKRAATYGRPQPNIVPITTADYPTPARRPANSELDTEGFAAAFGIAPRRWTVAVDEVVDRLMTEHA